jgi:hypothetical protein
MPLQKESSKKKETIEEGDFDLVRKSQMRLLQLIIVGSF